MVPGREADRLPRPSDLQWLPTGGLVVNATDHRASDDLTDRIYLLRPADGSLQPVTGPGFFSDLGVAPDGARLSYTEPPELYLWDGKSQAVAVSDLNAAWRSAKLVSPQLIRYRSFDGLEIAAPVTPAGPLLLVRRGYAVFYPNVRGSVGYGQRFVEANRGDWGGGDLKDIMVGIDTLVARGVADSTRLAIGGWSYRGYMSAWAVTQTTRFKAAVVGAGISDLVSEFGTEGQAWYDSWFNGWPQEHPELFHGRSPVLFASRVRTPTLILHGENGQVDPFGQAQELYRALKHYGVAAEFLAYPGEGHHLQERARLLDRLTRILGWYDTHLK